MQRWLRLAIGAITLFLSINAMAKAPWVTVYYSGRWTQVKDQGLKPNQIDYSALTHIIYFGIFPRADGTLDLDHFYVKSKEARQLTRLAHRAHKKVLIGLGIGAIPSEHVEHLTDNLVKFVRTFKYDGVDIDWEPFLAKDIGLYTDLINSLRTKLDNLSKRTHKKHYLLTAAVIEHPTLFAKLQDKFDQINLMTYDLSGLWLKQTWHNTPLYSPEASDLPSIDKIIKEFEDAGVAPRKLAVGIDFYGYQWTSNTEKISQPLQGWNQEPVIVSDISYADIVGKFLPLSQVNWDPSAQVPYLNRIINDNASFFLTYDDAASCKAKYKYVVEHGLGGIMAWELGAQWLPNAKVKDPLLQSLHSP